ncbi:synaptobrevin [Polychytrium aggregatum]|uniref:synaptobrevin n=1 Tax=Polychytrium aggregatum TaxID=110093 RepID=UPI0022FF3834|nr:synaptobrevin [Polychytrium aggregatum]KAI9207244.1 synaptobrevin [Polychytrium aggregatum]
MSAPPKTTQVQGQVDEVINIMQNNIEKVMARGEKIETLQNKTDDLQQGALQFKRGATKVRSQMWWKDFKLKIIIAVIVVVVLVIIIVPIVNSVKSSAPSSSTSTSS